MPTRRHILSAALSVVALTSLSLLSTRDVSAQEAQADATQVATRMQEFYNKTKTFQASFKQTYTDIAAGEAKVSFGRVYLKKPGKMRWDYYQKDDAGKAVLKKTMVSDGKAFWIYELEFQQVFKECMADSKLPTSVSFLMGDGDLLESFDVTLGPKSTKARPELKLVPKKPTSKYRELRFIVDGETYQVLKTTIYDPYGNTNEIVFDKVSFNKNLPDKGFAFKPPKGARELNPQKTCK